MYQQLLTLYLLLVVVIMFVGSVPILLIAYPLLTQKEFVYLNETLGLMILKAMTLPGFWSVKITDKRKEKTWDGQYVIVSNHLSFIDTLLMWNIPLYKKYFLAEKYSYFPIFGTLVKVGGHVLVGADKTNIIDKAYQSMNDGSSFVVYPEGKRSENQNKLLPFKTGAFRIAQKSNVPILPITIKGSGDAWGKGKLCNTANIEIIISDPICSDDIDIAMDQARNVILSNISKQ